MQKRTWIGGHKSSVLSLDVSREGILASGGEEELCVWSKDGAPQTKLSCSSAESKEVNSVCFCGKNPERLYASCGNKIFGYDLRNLSSTVCEFEFNEEEINQVTIHDRGTYLAACDDSGEVKVVDIQSGRLFKTLKRKHENICSTVQFRPSRPWEIVSGGMDFKVISWEFSSGRSLQELNVQELGEDSQEGAYFVNPPFVHSIHMAGNGRKFASGLGKNVLYVSTLGISGWGSAAGTLEPLTYTRASSAEILLPYTRVNSPNPPYPRVVVFQKLPRSLAQSSQNKTLYRNP